MVGAATATAAPLLNDLQANLSKTLKQAGASDEVADGIAQGISTVTAAGIGASVEMASGNGLAGTIVGGGTASATSDFLKGGGGQAAYFAPIIPVAPWISFGGGVNYSYGGKTSIEYGVSIPSGAGVNPISYGFETKKKEMEK